MYYNNNDNNNNSNNNNYYYYKLVAQKKYTETKEKLNKDEREKHKIKKAIHVNCAQRDMVSANPFRSKLLGDTNTVCHI